MEKRIKKLKSLTELDSNFVDSITELHNKMQSNYTELLIEHNNRISEEKVNLLMKICEGEKLDLNKFKKYLTPNDLKFIIEKPSNVIINNDNILNKIIIDKNEYYYEARENGNVYNNKSKLVGKYVNNKIIMVN